MDIYDIHGDLLSERWKAEFAGLFWGEGCLFLGTANRKTKHGFHLIYRPEAIITLRADDAPLLKVIWERLGGVFSSASDGYIDPKLDQKPRWRWYVQSREDDLRVANILSESIFPAKKARELPLWREAVLLRKKKGEKHTAEENQRLAYLLQEIRNIRVFKVPTF